MGIVLFCIQFCEKLYQYSLLLLLSPQILRRSIQTACAIPNFYLCSVGKHGAFFFYMDYSTELELEELMKSFKLASVMSVCDTCWACALDLRLARALKNCHVATAICGSITVPSRSRNQQNHNLARSSRSAPRRAKDHAYQESLSICAGAMDSALDRRSRRITDRAR